MGTAAVLRLTSVLVCLCLANCSSPTLLLSGKSGLFHLDAEGKLLEYRNETFQWWQRNHVAANPRNGTVCWVTAPEDQGKTGNMRCAMANDLSNAWDLPTPKNFRVNKPQALEIEPDTGNFYITVNRQNYVCNYDFQTCAKVGKSGGNVRFYAAYDLPNRLVFLIHTKEFGPYRMDVMNLDGSGRRQIADNSSLDYPYGLAVDSESKMVYWLDRYDGWNTGIYRFNHDGEGKELVAKLEDGFRGSHQKDLKIVGDDIFVLWGSQDKVSHVNKKTGEVSHLVDNRVTDNVTEIPFVKEELLSLNVISDKLQPPVENNCLRSRGGCGDICTPTVIEDRPSHTCICPAGQELVDTACFEREPAIVLVVHKNALQVVDVATQEASIILTGLTDATKADFFYEGKLKYLIFWLDDGGLFRGSWQYGGEVTDVMALVPAGGSVRVEEVAVDWNQRNVIWIERNLEAGKYDDNGAIFKIANVYGTESKTLAEESWRDQTALIVLTEGVVITFQQNSWGDLEFRSKNMEGGNEYFGFLKLKVPFKLREIRADLSALSDPTDERFFYIKPEEGSMLVATNDFSYSIERTYTLFTKDSLKNTGGMDVYFDQLFWTDTSRGALMTANSNTGGDITTFGPSGDGADLRAVRVLHPRKQPATRKVVCDEQNNGCSDMCVLVLRDWERQGECACPDGKTLSDDKKTCQ